MPDTAEQLVEILSEVARDGAIRAGRGISGLMGQEIVIHVPSVRAGTKAPPSSRWTASPKRSHGRSQA